MTSLTSLRQLHDLDKASSQFREQFIDFLRGDQYQDILLGLQREDLGWFIEYLDSVSLRTSLFVSH